MGDVGHEVERGPAIETIIYEDGAAFGVAGSSVPRWRRFGPRRQALVWVRDGVEILALEFDRDGRLAGDFAIPCGTALLTGRAGAVTIVRRADGGIELSGGLAFAETPLEGPLTVGPPASPEAGQMRFKAALPSNLACSIRYFYPDQKGLGRIVYPVILAGGNGLDAEIRHDPRRPHDRGASEWRLGSAGGTPSGLLTVEGVQLDLAIVGGSSALAPQWDPVDGAAYMAPQGMWSASLTGATGPVRLLCGLSGTEHFLTPPSFPARFVAGSPAYAPLFGPTASTGASGSPGNGSAIGLTGVCPLTSEPVTTSWLYLATPAAGPTATPFGYYSQPDSAGWFEPVANLLAPTALLTASLAADSGGAAGPSGFPIGLYGALAGAPPVDPKLLARFEAEILAPARTNAIHALAWPNPTGPLGPTGPSGPTGFAPVTGNVVTPQGLQLALADQNWASLTLASSEGQVLALADIDPRLAAVFQAGQLFMVIDAQGFANLSAWGLCTPLFDAIGIGDWTFQLDSFESNTVMIVKFAQLGLEALAADQSKWTLPSLTTADPTGAQSAILEAIARATGSDPDYDYFANTVLQDWNGILFLNVPVPAASFPAQLMALTAGMTAPLQAHHIGADLSPVGMSGGFPIVKDAKLFGLILHEDDSDLTYHGSAYDFKTRSLRVLFANSDIAAFSSQIELLVGQLFGERSVLVGGTRGDNIVLNGTLQKHGSSDIYRFAEAGPNSFAMQSAVLQGVQVTSAEMLTIAGPTGVTGQAQLAGSSGPTGASGATGAAFTALFPLAGTVAFQEQPGFDLFSFGPTGMTGPMPPAGGPTADASTGLRFSSLLVSMSFRQGDTNLADRSFAFDCSQAVFDLPASSARPGSLYDGFPLTATGFLQGGAGPSTLGYLPLSTPPLATGSLGATWYGLAMDLALGTRGGLAGMAPLTASLLTAWAPGSANAPANLATLAMLPGTKGIKSLGLQGPLKLELGDSSIDWSADAAGNPAYVMRFNDIALSLFGLKFPSGGRTNVALFGDPDPARKAASLGWYAAYQKNAAAGATAGPAPAFAQAWGTTGHG